MCDTDVFIALYWGPTKHCTGQHRTAQAPKILGNAVPMV